MVQLCKIDEKQDITLQPSSLYLKVKFLKYFLKYFRLQDTAVHWCSDIEIEVDYHTLFTTNNFCFCFFYEMIWNT